MSPTFGINLRKFLFQIIFLFFYIFNIFHCNAVPMQNLNRFYVGHKAIIKCGIDEIRRDANSKNLKEMRVTFCNLTKLENQFFSDFQMLKSLEIANSNVQEIEANAFDNLKQLKMLSLPHNFIAEVAAWSTESIKALTKLDLSRNLIRELTLKSFECYPNLQFLNLEANFLEDLHDGIFASMPYLKYLNLANNHLKAINGNVFNGMLRLTELSLHCNEIAAIQDNAFRTNLHLKVLDLSDNKLTSLAFLNAAAATGTTTTTTTQLTQLTHLNLSYNRLIEISPAAAYAKQNQLISLDLSHNVLLNLQNDSLHGLTSLQYLNLSHNFLDRITSMHLKDLNVLLDIDLSRNVFKQLPADLFNFTTLLHRIGLSYNKLSAINATLFAGMPHLSVIALAGNQLKNPNFLEYLAPALQHDELTLDLSDNHFGMSLNLSALEQFAAVQLAGNIWPCSWFMAGIADMADMADMADTADMAARRIATSKTLHFGHNYSVLMAWNMKFLNLSTVDCFDEGNKRSTVILQAPASYALQMSEKRNDFTNFHKNDKQLNASFPNFVWPKIPSDKFDSRSVIIWMLIAIALAFSALRVARQIIDRKEHKRLSVQWREKKNIQNGIELETVGRKSQRHVTIVEE